MSKKFFYLYLFGGILALILLVDEIITAYPKTISVGNILLDVVPAILLLYLAFKTYHEKKDHDLM